MASLIRKFNAMIQKSGRYLLLYLKEVKLFLNLSQVYFISDRRMQQNKMQDSDYFAIIMISRRNVSSFLKSAFKAERIAYGTHLRKESARADSRQYSNL
jgi:hypothetical protein